MKRFKNLVILFVLILAIFVPANINANSKVSDLQKQIKDNDAKRSKNAAELKELKNEKDSTIKEIKRLDLQAEDLNLEITGIELNIEELNSKITSTESAIEDLKKSIDENNTLLEQRLRASYKRGEVGYLEIILNSDNLIDALTRMDIIQLIVKDDVDLIGEIRTQKSSLEDLKILQEDNKKTLEAKKSELVSTKNKVLALQNEREVYMAGLEQDIKERMKVNEELLKASKELEKTLDKLLSEEKYVGGEMKYPLPLEFTTITSYFGKRPHPIYGYVSDHRGTDIRCPTGTEVYAANDGKVIISGWHSQFGNYIVIDHGGKIATLYAHNSKLLVKVGQEVTRGQVISKSGSTGMSTGPHLHFEVRINGVPVDGLPYIQKKQ